METFPDFIDQRFRTKIYSTSRHRVLPHTHNNSNQDAVVMTTVSRRYRHDSWSKVCTYNNKSVLMILGPLWSTSTQTQHPSIQNENTKLAMFSNSDTPQIYLSDITSSACWDAKTCCVYQNSNRYIIIPLRTMNESKLTICNIIKSGLIPRVHATKVYGG